MLMWCFTLQTSVERVEVLMVRGGKHARHRQLRCVFMGGEDGGGTGVMTKQGHLAGEAHHLISVARRLAVRGRRVAGV